MKSLISLACAASAVLLVAGCAHTSPKPPADASASLVCRDGSPFTEKGQCAGHGGIDHERSQAKAEQSRDKDAKAERAAGAPGEVWADPARKTYVCSSDPDYGKAGEGQYMTEAQAKAKGLQPAHGSCAH